MRTTTSAIAKSVNCLLVFLAFKYFASAGVAAESPTKEATPSNSIRFNQIQVIGTHNSYHIAPNEAMLKAIGAKSVDLAKSLDYTHRSLPEQFTHLGIRQIELDVFADPTGGLYAQPAALKTIPGAARMDDEDSLMKKPGMKVLHVQDIDYTSTVSTLKQGLQQVRNWLNANPTSSPIMVMLELKQSSIGAEFTQPHPFEAEELDAIDAEILAVFDGDQIILPDDVRGDRETLLEAITKDGWPKLDDVRGKVIFAMDNGGELPEAYLKDHPSLRGRIMFVPVDERHPAAAFLKLNDPISDFDRVQSAVKSGFVVRTRADAGTKESRLNDTTRREKALESGAQFISTDYPEPDQRFSDDSVRFDGGIVARANPVNATEFETKEYDNANKNRVHLIAHRGGIVDEGRIENNIPAIEEAIERGYAMLEVDIRESKDGQLVVHDDANFRRFYNDPRKVADLTWDEIKQLRSEPGGLRPLLFEEFAKVCRGKIRLMLDTKGPEHSDEFFAQMERILMENGLLSSALVIGTEQSQKFLRGKAKTSVNRRELEAAIQAGDDVVESVFLFERGNMTDETVKLAQKHGVLVVPSVNTFHYQSDHLSCARADIERLKELGVTHFQIDSVYESFCRP